MGDKKKLLLVDDDPGILKSLQCSFHGNDYALLPINSTSDALGIIYNEKIDLILCDLLMPEIDSYAFFEKVRVSHPETIRIILSGLAENTIMSALYYIADIFIEHNFGQAGITSISPDALRCIGKEPIRLRKLFRLLQGDS